MVATRQAVEHLLCLDFFRVYQLLPLFLLSPPQFRSALRGCGFLRNCICQCMPRFLLPHSKFESLISTTSTFLVALHLFTLGGRGLRSNLDEF